MHPYAPARADLALGLLPSVYVTSHPSFSTVSSKLAPEPRNEGLADVLKCADLPQIPLLPTPSPLLVTALLGEDAWSTLWSGNKELGALSAFRTCTLGDLTSSGQSQNPGGWLFNVSHVPAPEHNVCHWLSASWKSNYRETCHPVREGAGRRETGRW